jgi:hypothetical protein
MIHHKQQFQLSDSLFQNSYAFSAYDVLFSARLETPRFYHHSYSSTKAVKVLHHDKQQYPVGNWLVGHVSRSSVSLADDILLPLARKAEVSITFYTRTRRRVNYCIIMHSYALRLFFITCLIIIDTGWSMHLDNGDNLFCLWTEQRRAQISDCEAAIRMIPSGTPELAFTPSENKSKPVNLHLDHNGGRAFRLPAVFLAGSCAIKVRNIPVHSTNRWERLLCIGGCSTPPPQQAATFMYFRYWPNVKEVAGEILRRCLTKGDTAGQIETRSEWEGWDYYYLVWMGPGPRDLLGRNGTDLFGEYNIYESLEVPFVRSYAVVDGDKHG